MKIFMAISLLLIFGFVKTQPVIPEILSIYPAYLCPFLCNWSNCVVHVPFGVCIQDHVDRDIKFHAAFGEDCIYQDNKTGWNKLEVISRTGYEQQRSLRLGWRTNQTPPQEFEIGLYAHISNNIESVNMDFQPSLGLGNYYWYYLRMAWHGMYARAGDNSYCIKRKIFEPGVDWSTDFIQGAYKEHCPGHIMHINVDDGDWDAGNDEFWLEGDNKGFCNSIFYSDDDFTVQADNSITAPLPNTNDDTGAPYTTIESGANVTFIAGTEIILKKGFDVQPGAIFNAVIGTSNNMTNLFPPGFQLISKNYLEPETLYKELGIDEEESENKEEFLNFEEYQQPSHNSLSIFPNPHPGIFAIEWNDPSITEYSLEVINSIGCLVYERKNVLPGITEIDISSQPKGIYFIRIQAGDKIYSEKMIYQ